MGIFNNFLVSGIIINPDWQKKEIVDIVEENISVFSRAKLFVHYLGNRLTIELIGITEKGEPSRKLVWEKEYDNQSLSEFLVSTLNFNNEEKEEFLLKGRLSFNVDEFLNKLWKK